MEAGRLVRRQQSCEQYQGLHPGVGSKNKRFSHTDAEYMLETEPEGCTFLSTLNIDATNTIGLVA